ncbi:MAG: hypothetical protein JKX79_00145 [Labilibaculum sp.]|nr:hypothetical protein [Labilibaculum sp.]
MSSIQNIDIKNIQEELRKFLEHTKKCLPHISIYTVIFSFNNDNLNVLLLRFGDTQYFSLPGGFVLKNEKIDDASLRILKKRTDLSKLYIEQFTTTGNVENPNEDIYNETLKKMGIVLPDNNLMNQRRISICYYSLIDAAKVNPKGNDFFVSEVKWRSVQKLPELMYDHKLIIEKAISKLQLDMDRKLVSYNLMNETFTMGELQKLYEAVFQREFTRTNFQRKMLSLNILERLDKKYSGESHKAPYLYRFKNIQ